MRAHTHTNTFRASSKICGQTVVLASTKNSRYVPTVYIFCSKNCYSAYFLSFRHNDCVFSTSKNWNVKRNSNLIS